MTLSRRAGSRRRGGRIRAVAALALCCAAIAGGAVTIMGASRGSQPPAAPLPTHQFSLTPEQVAALPQAGGPADASGTGPGGSCAYAPPAAGHLVIPSLCVDAPMVPEVFAGGELTIPSDVRKTAIWSDGAAPAAAQGTTLVAGHVNYIGQGDGALSRLAGIQPGALIEMADPDSGAISRWKVVGLSAVIKSRLPSQLFAGPLGDRRLYLVTCGGPVIHYSWGNSYRDNVVVEAVPDTPIRTG